MSTRCNVAVRVREEDKGKQVWPYLFIEPDTNYLMIYIHHDGYPKGVGRELLEGLTNYKDALEFVSVGDRTSVKIPYTALGEDYESNKPAQLKSIRGAISEEYLYVYEKDVWLVTDDGSIFNTVKDVLEEDIK